jgi:hypothetical protein
VKQPDPIPELQDSDIEIVDFRPAPSAVPERSTKAKGKQKAAHDDGGGSDGEMGEVQKHKKKKTKDAEKVAETREPTKAKAAKPKKTSPIDDADEGHSKPKANSRKRTAPDPPKKSKAKTSQPKEDSEDAAATEADAAPKKKKRKINLFGGSQPTTFDWNVLAQVFLFSLTMEWQLTRAPY